MSQKKEVELRKNKTVLAIAEIMKKEGFASDFSEDDRSVYITLTKDTKGMVLSDVKRVSSGGQRIYVDSTHLKKVLGGRGIGIVSTSQGVMTVEEAKAKKVGGEYICKMW